MLGRKTVNCHESDVMPRAGIFIAYIPKSDYQVLHCFCRKKAISLTANG